MSRICGAVGTIKMRRLKEAVEETLVYYPQVRLLAPTVAVVTDYDQEMAFLYLIIHRESRDTPWYSLSRRYFRLPVQLDPELVKACFDSHLARATWYVEIGRYLFLEELAGEDDMLD